MRVIGEIARGLCALALTGALGLGSCAVKDGQPCIILPDLSCAVPTPAPVTNEVYYDPTGKWVFVSVYDGTEIEFDLAQTRANELTGWGATWSYRGANVWDASDGSEMEMRSLNEGYVWWNDVDDEQGWIHRLNW